MLLLLLLSAAPNCGLLEVTPDVVTVDGGVLRLPVPGLEARCDGRQLIIEAAPSWPSPLRLERDADGSWHDVVAVPPTERDEAVLRGWLARDEALTAMTRTSPVRHVSARAQLQQRLEAVPRLTGFTRIGTMPGTQASTDAYWSKDTVCVTQGTSKQVRCWSPATTRWSELTPFDSKPGSPTSIAYDAHARTLSRGSRSWPLDASLASPAWTAVLEQEDTKCRQGIPSRAEREAVECADPSSTRCAQWARYGPATEEPPTCVETVEAVRFSPDEALALLVVRVTERGGYGTLVLFVARRQP